MAVKMYLFHATLLITTSWSLGQVLDSVRSAIEKPAPSENFSYHEVLDDHYDLYWNFNNTHIIFETIVKTNGYVGFGISPNGGMAGSDIVIGGVKDGEKYFTDRFAIGNAMPSVDDSQDWFLLSAVETGDYTVLKMVRKLETCDHADRAILKGTTRVIYSYSSVDPDSETNIPYHGSTTRGTMSMLLLDPPVGHKSAETQWENVKTIEFRSRNYSVPGKSTTYHAYIFKLADLGQKYHVLRFEPHVTKGHEKLVHHMGLYACSRPLNDSLVGASFETESTPEDVKGVCESMVIAWAIGGKAFDFPAHVGLSLGTPRDPSYFRLETHFTNPDMRTDFIDNSGLRLYLTTDLRQYDAQIVSLGLVPDLHQVIPPREKNFLTQAYCQSSCLENTLRDREIHVFATFLHAHLLSRQLRIRHFRKGVEFPPLAEDNNYDFNFQQTRDVSPEVTLRKGDSLITECNYDSTDRSNATFGGMSTLEEMCQSYFYYYPRLSLKSCYSRFLFDKLPSEYSRKDVNFDDIVNQLDWTKAHDKQTFYQALNDSSIYSICTGDSSDVKFNITMEPQPRVPRQYQAPSSCTEK